MKPLNMSLKVLKFTGFYHLYILKTFKSIKNVTIYIALRKFGT